MAAAPIWHTQHRVLGEILSSASRKLAELDAARAAQAAPPAARRESPERDLSPPGPGYAQLAPVGVKETSGRPCVVSLRATPTRPPAATAPQGTSSDRTKTNGRRGRRCSCDGGSRNHFTASSSTSNTRVALGGITPPAPRAP
jgi:hypothetical protein